MKTLRIIILFIIISFPAHLLAQEKNRYEIIGHIDGLEEGEKLTMKLFYGSGPNDGVKRDSAIVKDGQFHIIGVVPDGPRMYWLQFGNHGHHWCNLWIDNDQKITIIGSNIDKIPSAPIGEYVEITGSPTNKGREILVNMERLYLQERGAINNELDKIKDSIGFNAQIVEGLIRSNLLLDDRYYQTILAYETPFTKPIRAYTLVDTKENDGQWGHQSFYKKAYDKLDESAKNGFYGRQLKEISELSVGQSMPAFTLPTPEGKLISLKDVAATSKLTLVWFWATNSFDKERYEKELVALYPRYHSKGLNMVAVSADTSKDDWSFMIHQKKYPWINVSDGKGWKKGSIINDTYKEGGHQIPNSTNVLVDQKGNIVAWDPTGVELQWYLWKYLDSQTPEKTK